MAKMFWLILTIACVVWYTFVTLYVAVKGFGDIREMLRNMGEATRNGHDE